jgi:hypothetical protein
MNQLIRHCNPPFRKKKKNNNNNNNKKQNLDFSMDLPGENLRRNMRALAESPLPPTPLRTALQQSNMSPMSGLAQHLGATCSLNPPSPRRRLSLSSVATGTPSPLHLRHRLLQGKDHFSLFLCNQDSLP